VGPTSRILTLECGSHIPNPETSKYDSISPNPNLNPKPPYQFKRVGEIERRVVHVEEKLGSIADLGQTIAAMAIKMGVRPSHRPPAYSSQGQILLPISIYL
jgi:hypothetical protein